MRASIAFYRKRCRHSRSADMAHRPVAPHVTAVEPGATEAQVSIRRAAFAQIWNKGWAGRKDLAGRVVVGFGVSSREEVDRLYGEMTATGHRGLQAPFDAFWGARYAIVEDPDGIAVGLMSPISAKHRAPPPAV